MNEISFEWDSSKAASNAKKHGVSFEEARTVFYDEHALLIPDPVIIQPLKTDSSSWGSVPHCGSSSLFTVFAKAVYRSE
jgi:hypothetical protein